MMRTGDVQEDGVGEGVGEGVDFAEGGGLEALFWKFGEESVRRFIDIKGEWHWLPF